MGIAIPFSEQALLLFDEILFLNQLQ